MAIVPAVAVGVMWPILSAVGAQALEKAVQAAVLGAGVQLVQAIGGDRAPLGSRAQQTMEETDALAQDQFQGQENERAPLGSRGPGPIADEQRAKLGVARELGARVNRIASSFSELVVYVATIATACFCCYRLRR